MVRTFMIAVASAAVFTLSTTAFAQGTATEAKAMLAKTVSAVKADKAKALDMFVAIYGAFAGNVALVLKATGGVFIGGGIAPKILEKLKDGTFIGAFMEKGRMSSLVATIPVRVILNDKTALLGAARVAAKKQ